MLIFWLFAITAGLQAEPLQWQDLAPSMRALVTQAGLTESAFPEWLVQRHEAATDRLASGAAEHIAYFLLQSATLLDHPPLNPAREAKRYLQSLPGAERAAFLAGSIPVAPLAAPVRRRMDAFWNRPPASERHSLLRGMAERLGWPPEKVVLTAFRFLNQQSGNDDIYQTRGLSADPFPPSMRAVERGLEWLRGHRGSPIRDVFLAGPGAELGSRFGINDSQAVLSPQPRALLALLPQRPAAFDCADIRREVVATLKAGPCRAFILDLVTERITSGPYDLAVATNLLVYLNDIELALALTNLAQAMRPGACLLHNDSRFAARLFGEAAGIPVQHFQAVQLGTREGRQQVDRIVVHCKPRSNP